MGGRVGGKLRGRKLEQSFLGRRKGGQRHPVGGRHVGVDKSIGLENQGG